jgi:hypothetical protein
LDAATLATASAHKPEVVLAGLLKERDQAVHDAARDWRPDHAHLPGALTKSKHDRRVFDAQATLTHLDEETSRRQANCSTREGIFGNSVLTSNRRSGRTQTSGNIPVSSSRLR